MILIGMFDSPFVRRVAVSAKTAGLRLRAPQLVHWQGFRPHPRIQPAGRVPTLVLDDGEALVESAAILDWLDERAGLTAGCCRHPDPHSARHWKTDGHCQRRGGKSRAAAL